MSVFPETPRPICPVIIEPEFYTLVSPFDSGGEQRREGWVFPKYNATVQYHALSAANQQLLWNFFMATKGQKNAFWFFDPAPIAGNVTSHVGQYVGIGNGVSQIFDLPGKSTSTRVLYVNGAVQSSGFSYLTGGGDGSADRVQFTVAPALGDLITVDFTGQLRIRSRFAADKLSRESFSRILFNYGIKLKGLGPV